jgi:hypothetical protein
MARSRPNQRNAVAVDLRLISLGASLAHRIMLKQISYLDHQIT